MRNSGPPPWGERLWKLPHRGDMAEAWETVRTLGKGTPRLQGLGADAQSLSTRVGYNEPEAGDGVAVSGRVCSPIGYVGHAT